MVQSTTSNVPAPADGVITTLEVAIGEQVEVGAVLARVEADNHEGEQP